MEGFADGVGGEAGEMGEEADGETTVMGCLENGDTFGLREVAKRLWFRKSELIV